MRRPFPNRRSFTPKRTCGISYSFEQLSLSLGYVPTCYSAVRRSCTPEGALPLDLHVLGTPPAFILSQDQTLHKKEFVFASVEHLVSEETKLTYLKQFKVLIPVTKTS